MEQKEQELLNSLATPRTTAKLISTGQFEADKHWYPKALNATIHPMVSFFLNLEQERIVQRYCHMHPKVNYQDLRDILNYQPKYFRWAGADLLHVTTENSKRQMVVIETNSCPSGQKSMPLLDDFQEQGGYRKLMSDTFAQLLQKRNLLKGDLAVIYDKNPMEASGYAATMADVMKESVHFVQMPKDEKNPAVRFVDEVMYVYGEDKKWHPIRAAFRYVTQRPWDRIPLHSKTRILNPPIACLAGGRNKMVAAKAYDLYNSELENSGLKIITPETIWDVSKNEIPLWVKKLGGQAVVKVPYSNAGQGVYTIVNEEELESFMLENSEYDQYIVQSLIGNYKWSSTSSKGKLYHVGTMPNAKGNSYVADLRMMVHATPNGIRPICVYARRAEKPLVDELISGDDSWAMLGTNLSIKRTDGGWDSDTNRLILMDRRDFNKLGIGIDDLIEAYIQTVLSMIAIDKMCIQLMNSKGRFRMKLFKSLNDDASLLSQIML
jgi:hypothetical protein